MRSLNTAVAEQTSEKAWEFSNNAITSSLNPAEEDPPSITHCKYREQECCIFIVDH